MENNLSHLLHNLLLLFITVAAILTGIRAAAYKRIILATSMFLLLSIPLTRLDLIDTWLAQIMINLAVFGIFYKINWFLTVTKDRPEHPKHLDKPE